MNNVILIKYISIDKISTIHLQIFLENIWILILKHLHWSVFSTLQTGTCTSGFYLLPKYSKFSAPISDLSNLRLPIPFLWITFRFCLQWALQGGEITCFFKLEVEIEHNFVVVWYSSVFLFLVGPLIQDSKFGTWFQYQTHTIYSKKKKKQKRRRKKKKHYKMILRV